MANMDNAKNLGNIKELTKKFIEKEIYEFFTTVLNEIDPDYWNKLIIPNLKRSDRKKLGDLDLIDLLNLLTNREISNPVFNQLGFFEMSQKHEFLNSLNTLKSYRHFYAHEAIEIDRVSFLKRHQIAIDTLGMFLELVGRYPNDTRSTLEEISNSFRTQLQADAQPPEKSENEDVPDLSTIEQPSEEIVRNSFSLNILTQSEKKPLYRGVFVVVGLIIVLCAAYVIPKTNAKKAASGLHPTTVSYQDPSDQDRLKDMVEKKWAEINIEVEKAKELMISGRSEGENAFHALLTKYGDDGMIYFKMGEAYESIGLNALAFNCYLKAEKLFPYGRWKKNAVDKYKKLSIVSNK